MPNELSDACMLILEYLWSRDTPARFSEIMSYCNDVKKKNWKKQTINTFLSRLAKKGLICVDKNHSRAEYFPALSQEDYYQQQAKKIVDESYHGSIKNFIYAFTGCHKLTDKEKDELLEFIERL
ncbi:MAG: BlaI/MecI/CopY family transcriptional regulator [Eubacteriales bacterium]|nr:BlaI/MecI/CopY family transcriptional regulator [Eubacteriales bacterium]